jgi:hypothetical protein
MKRLYVDVALMGQTCVFCPGAPGKKRRCAKDDFARRWYRKTDWAA